jgi:hypothetical protein
LLIVSQKSPISGGDKLSTARRPAERFGFEMARLQLGFASRSFQRRKIAQQFRTA